MAEEVVKYEFDEAFCEGLVALCLRDSEFMRRSSQLVEPSYFEKRSEQCAVQMAKVFFKRYDTAIDNASIINALKDAIASKIIRDEDKGNVKELIKKCYSNPLPSRAPIEEKVATFARQQAIRNAMIKSVDWLQEGKFEKIEQVMKEACEVGVLDGGDTYDYFEKIEERTKKREEQIAGILPPTGITTGVAQLDAVLYHRGWGRRELVSIMGSAKMGKCLNPSTLVFTDNGLCELGSLIPSDLEVGKYAEQRTRILGRNGLEETSHAYNNGMSQTKRVTTKNIGLEIEGTHNHPVLVLDKSGNFDWRMLSELKVGDYVAVQQNAQVYGSNTFIGKGIEVVANFVTSSTYATRMNITGPYASEMTPDFAELLGMLVAEGYMDDKNRVISFTQKDPLIIDRFVELFDKFFHIKPKVEESHHGKDCSSASVSNVCVAKYLKAIGLKFDRSAKQEIPWSVLQAPRECVLRFLSAVLGLEGNIRSSGNEKVIYDLTMASKKLIKQIQMLLLNEGIRARYSVKPSMATNGLRIVRNYYRLQVAGSANLCSLKKIGVYEPRKQKVLDSVKGFVKTAQDPIPCEDLMRQVIDDIRSRDDIVIYYTIDRGMWKHVRSCVTRDGRRPSRYVVQAVIEAFDKIGFTSPAYEKLRAVLDTGYYFDQVASIEEGECETVDLTVPGTHSFFSNGLVSHNTAAIINFAKNASMAGYNVLYVTLEVSAAIISERLDACLSDKMVNRLADEFPDVRKRIKEAAKRAGKLYINEFPSGSMTCAMLRRLLDRYRALGTQFDLIVVDYADIMAPNFRTKEVIENMKSIYIDLRAIAFDYNAAVLTATQTNREGAKSAVAKAEHVSEDFNKVRTVDLLISINKTEEEASRHEARLYFAASRNQESGFTVRIEQDMAKMQFIKRVLRIE